MNREIGESASILNMSFSSYLVEKTLLYFLETDADGSGQYCTASSMPDLL